MLARPDVQRNLIFSAVVAAVLAVALAALTSAAFAQQRPTTWSVSVGSEATATGMPPMGPEDLMVASNDFGLTRLEIRVGDTIEFRSNAFHNVAIGRDRVAPFLFTEAGLIPNIEALLPSGGNTVDGSGVVNSGFLEGPATFSATFTRAGQYPVVCDIHPQSRDGAGMAMTVEVKPVGQALAMTPEQANQAAQASFLNDWATRALPLIVNNSRIRVGTFEGFTIREVSAGFGDGHVEGLRFLPQDLVIRAGEWVRWINPDPDAPHMVTLAPGGGLPEGPPPEDVDPIAAAFTKTGNVYDGTNFVNQPVVRNPMFQPPGITDRAEIQFTAPGTYTYFCIIHAQLGMVGTITVLP